MHVIILDSHQKSALAAVRSLGRAGVVVMAGAPRPFAMGSYSRFVSERFVYPDPCSDRDDFLECVQKYSKETVAKLGVRPLILCFSDATQNALFSEYEESTSDFVLCVPSRASYEIAQSKTKTYELAECLNIPTIQTYRTSAYKDVTYPAVVKYTESVVWKEGKGVRGSAEFVFSKEELEVKVQEVLQKTGQAPLIQEFIQGDEYGVEMVCEEGVPLATFVHKRIRSLSPRGGAAVVKETAEENQQTQAMVRYAYTLVEKLRWIGPVMVEFKVSREAREGALMGHKVNDKDGTVRLMEINGRFWGSLPLAVRAGVDFPLIAYRLGRGEDTGDIQEAFSTPYVRTRHFLGDVVWVCRVLFTRDPMRAHLYPSRLRALWDFKMELFKSKSDTFLRSDLLPWLMEYVGFIRGFLGRYVK